VTTVAAVTERHSVSIWLTVARGHTMATATRVTFGVLSRRAITVSIAVLLAARIPMLPLKRSLPVASGVPHFAALALSPEPEAPVPVVLMM